MSTQSSSLEQLLPPVREAFNRAAHPAEDETASVKSLVIPLLNDESLWQALEQSEDSPSKQEARELLFGLLRIAQNDEHSRIPRSGIVGISKRLKQIMTAAKNGDVKAIFRGSSWDRQKTIRYVHQIQSRRNQLHMTIADSLTPKPDQGVIYPPLEAVQDDLRFHTLISGDHIALGRWENPKAQALRELAQVQAQLAQEVPTDKLSQAEQQYLGILSALAVFNLRFAQLMGRMEFIEAALDMWAEYDQYLQARLKEFPESPELRKNLNKDRLTAITKQALLGTLTVVDFDLRTRLRVRKKAHQLQKISEQGVYLEPAA